MKNLFSINKSASDGAAAFDDNPYLARRVSLALRERIDHAFDVLKEEPAAPPLSDEQTAIKKRGRILWCVGIATLVAAIALFLIAGSNTEKWLLVLQFALLIASVVTTFLARRIDAKLHVVHRESLDVHFEAASERLNAIAEDAARELGVPKGAASLEILPYQYKMAGEREMRVGKRSHFDNISTSAWIEGDILCLATAQELFRIPLSAIITTRPVDEDYEIDFWLKDEAYDSETYKEFNIRPAGMLGKKAHGYHAVELKGDYEFFVPDYDWAVFDALTES